MPLSEAERDSVLLTIAVLSSLSVLLSTFVVITFSVFEEKRTTSTGRLVLAVTICALLFNVSFLIAAFGSPDVLAFEGGLCYLQGVGLLFFGSCLMFLWFALTLNLYIRVVLDKEEPRARWYIVPSVVASVIMTAIPWGTRAITYDGVWCFINSNQYDLLFGCFYGEMIVVTIASTALWALVLQRMLKSLRMEQRKSAVLSGSLTKGAGDINSGENTRLLVSNHNGGGPSSLASKWMLMVRQVIFVTGFLIMFYVMLINRLVIIAQGATFAGWMAHGICNSLIGTYVFLVFGSNSRNGQLWYGLFEFVLFPNKVKQPLSAPSKV